MKETFLLGHISDLHFSNGTSKDAVHSHSIAYLQQIEQVFEGKAFDKVIVSGDLTDRGDKESLLLVRDWLYNSFSVSATEETGLHLSAAILGLVPGNHDAYNCQHSKGSPLDCWQKSIEHYNAIFPAPPLEVNGCRYDWLEKGDQSIYIAYVDSCFLGDPTVEHYSDIKQLAISHISKVARGKLSTRQSRQLVRWFDRGMQGQLLHPARENESISKERFAKSFKIVVMHHYLFEPTGYEEDFFLKLNHRDVVFRNFALADFDMCLCGHKHVPEFKTLFYGEHFDKRARGRYIVELFRRTIGIQMMPFQFEGPNGRRFPERLTQFIQLLYLKIKSTTSRDLDAEEYADELIKLLAKCLDKPASFARQIEEFVATYESSGYEFISEESIHEIQSRISSELSKERRHMLTGLASTYLRRAIRTINQRPFIQSLAGSACKRSNRAEKARSFNTYSISMEDATVRVMQTKYTLTELGEAIARVTESEYTFHNHHMLNCKIATA